MGLHGYDCRSLMIPRFYLNFNYFHLICLCLIVAAPKVGKSDLFFNLSFRVLVHPDRPSNQEEESGRAAQKEEMWCFCVSCYFTGNACC